MKQVVILNAPPFCGKDTLADLMVELLSAEKLEFKDSLYQAVAEHFNLNLNYVKYICTSRKYKDNTNSNASQLEFMGRTPREAMIHVSEEIYKPHFGVDYFGVQAAKKLVDGVNAFSDGGGWWEELLPVVKAADEVIICRLYREGYTFDGDSRSYYSSILPSVCAGKVRMCDIHLEENKPLVAIDAIKDILI